MFGDGSADFFVRHSPIATSLIECRADFRCKILRPDREQDALE